MSRFRHQYDILSEYAHPNWAGTALLFSKPDPATKSIEFGQNVRSVDSPYGQGVFSLSGALLVFEYSYNRLNDFMPKFIELCEKAILGKDAGAT